MKVSVEALEGLHFIAGGIAPGTGHNLCSTLKGSHNPSLGNPFRVGTKRMALFRGRCPRLWSLSPSGTFKTGSKNMVFVSAATAREITIKKALSKIETPDNFEEALEVNHFLPLPVTIRHALAVGELPPIHQDPFDRMLVAQAKVEGLTLVTRDEEIQKYRIPFLAA